MEIVKLFQQIGLKLCFLKSFTSSYSIQTLSQND